MVFSQVRGQDKCSQIKRYPPVDLIGNFAGEFHGDNEDEADSKPGIVDDRPGAGSFLEKVNEEKRIDQDEVP